MFGIGPAHVRALCETETSWGIVRCYTPREVGDMTLDMIFMLLCEKKLLRSSKQQRYAAMTSDEAVSLVDPKTGMIRGRTADGVAFEAKPGGGESLAGRLIAAERERELRTAEREKRRQERRQQRKERKKQG